MMPPLLFIAILAAVPACAQEIWQLGGRGGLSWSDEATLYVTGDETTAGAFQPMELRPDVNVLPLIGQNHPWDRWQFPLDPFRTEGMPRLWRGPSNSQGTTLFQPISIFVDGDRETFHRQKDLCCGKPFSEYYTFSPGAPLPLERFEIHLPSEFLEDGSSNPNCCDRLGTPWSHYVPHQGELTGSLIETLEMLTEGEGVNYQIPNYHPLSIPLASVSQITTAPLIIEFPLQYLGFVRWKSFADTGEADDDGRPFGAYETNFDAIGYGEFELYGRGFARQGRIVTRVQDLGEPMTLGRVFMEVSKWQRVNSGWLESSDEQGNVQRRWQVGELVEVPDAEVSASWRIKIGLTDDPLAYYTWSDQIELVEIDRAEWDTYKTPERDRDVLGYRGPVTENRHDWTGWSGRVTDSSAHLDMPSRRYFQLQVTTTTANSTQMARVDSLSIEFFPLLTPTLVGEVGVMGDSVATLAQVHIGKPFELVYAIRAEFDGEEREGFDAVRISTPAEPEFLYLMKGASRDGVELTPDEIRVDPEGLTLFLPEQIQDDEELSIGLRTSMYTVSTRMIGEVFNRDNSAVRQRVEEGDATERIRTNKLGLIAGGDEVRQVIAVLTIEPRIVTPNGDGRNDDVQFDYTLLGVLDADVEIAIYTLAGERVHSIDIANVAGGEHAHTWNGRTATGALVAPGVYLAQATAKTGRGSFAITRPISVAY